MQPQIITLVALIATGPDGQSHLNLRAVHAPSATLSTIEGDLQSLDLWCDPTATTTLTPTDPTDWPHAWSATVPAGKACELRLDFDQPPRFELQAGGGTHTVEWPSARIELSFEDVPTAGGIVLVHEAIYSGSPTVTSED